MAKRSRTLYEADIQAKQSPFVAFGTPLPPAEGRDDGSFVPVWKQEARDAQGRRRFHGAFTGGWSAGYYNTLGSKEGWTPSTFVSSRMNRRKDDPNAAVHRPEDYMDEEDLADAEEARKIQTSQAFAGLGMTENDLAGDRGDSSGLAGLFRATGETMGTKLLKRMGWKDGQGIGPKVRRAAWLDVGRPGSDSKSATYLFAPENVTVVRLVKKTDRKGLDFEGEERLASRRDADDDESSDDEKEKGVASSLFGRLNTESATRKKKSKKERNTGIGIGVLNDTGSDDENDPYDLGPRISFKRALGVEKKKKTKSTTSGAAASSGSKSKLVFSSSRLAVTASKARTERGRLCHDGRPPLAGFVLGRTPDALTSDVNTSANKYPPLAIPQGWQSAKKATKRVSVADGSAYASTADAAKASKMDPKTRAAVLGEGQLPGKSVFDFLSPDARDRIAAATGRSDLPKGLGEIPAGYALSEAEKQEQLRRAVPVLDKVTAVAAITRGARGGGPYQEDEAKRGRYRGYLEFHAGIAAELPPKPPRWKDDDWLRECYEFYDCARIFRPMAGPMASRFTTAGKTAAIATARAGSTPTGLGEDGDGTSLVTRPATKALDPAEEAAKMGMYGPMTRSVQPFYPSQLLCKRLGVQAPALEPADADETPQGPAAPSAAASNWASTLSGGSNSHRGLSVATAPQSNSNATVQTDRNEALEGKRAGEDVFRAVFGNSDDEEA